MSVIVIGNFDGVHCGHKKILKQAVRIAEDKKTESIAITFYEHPKNILCKRLIVTKLNDIETKIKRIKETGINKVEVINFDRQFSEMTAVEFVLMLKKKYECTDIVCGCNSNFGRRASCNSCQLKNLALPLGVEVTIVDIDKNNEASSSVIRKFIESGDILKANSLLGYEYSFEAEVLKGKQLGRQLDFPTLNQKIPDDFTKPKPGVYITNTIISGQRCIGVTNVGRRPTVEKCAENILSETHLLNHSFNEDCYGKTFKIFFIDRIRDEIRFASVDELKKQISRDCELAKKYL